MDQPTILEMMDRLKGFRSVRNKAKLLRLLSDLAGFFDITRDAPAPRTKNVDELSLLRVWGASTSGSNPDASAANGLGARYPTT
jgi:hypothetical protein